MRYALLVYETGELGSGGAEAAGPEIAEADPAPDTASQAHIAGMSPAFGPPALGRPLTTAETASAAAFLASDAASGMTGQVVTVSPGGVV